MSTLLSHAGHWGAYQAETAGDRIVGVRPAPGDPAPPGLLAGVVGAQHSKLRIDRPYVRQGWLNGDRAGGTPRGGEPFVPVGWDTATRLVGDEIARVRDTHGPASIFGGSYGWSSAGRFHHARSQLHRMLATAGGFTGQVGNYSFAAGMTILPHVLGSMDAVQGPILEWRSITSHAKLLVCFGGVLLRNGQITAGGGGRHQMGEAVRAAARAGVRLVSISPVGGDMPLDVPADWIAIRPGTDTAMMLAMAHVLIAEDRVAQDFLATRTVGFARLRAYVLGESDGVAKTPEWAAGITGVPAPVITALARDCATMPTTLTAAWSLQRAEFGDQPYWMLVSLAAMLGGIGRPGEGVGFGLGSMNGMGAPGPGLASMSFPARPNPIGSFIPVARVTEMLERPGGEYEYNGQHRRYPDTRLIYWVGGNPFHHHQDLGRLQRGWARAETIVVHEPWWNAHARHADIVLPATTTLERDDIGSGARDRYLLAMHRAVRPHAQARDDFSICSDIAEHLGLRDSFTEGRDAATWLRVMYGRWRESGRRLGLELPDYDTFWQAGEIELPVPDAPVVPMAAFAADPAAHPLRTPSGRIELFSETIDRFGYDDCPGHAVWRAPQEYLGAELARRYPLHLLTPQPEMRLHSQLDQWGVSLASKISGREPILMHTADAAARGLAEGDVVRVFNDRGACLAGVRLTEHLLQGVACLATGAWFDPLEQGVAGSLCVHGNPNVLTQDVGTSRLAQGPSAQSCLVEVTRWDAALPPIRVNAPPDIREAE